MLRRLTSNPILLGILISLGIATLLLILVIWFPRAVEAWDTHGAFVQACWYTAAIFGVIIYRFRRWRHRVLFWTSIFSLFVAHIVGVALYSSRVHPLFGWQWIALILLEVAIAVFLLDWLFSKHHDRRHDPDRANA